MRSFLPRIHEFFAFKSLAYVVDFFEFTVVGLRKDAIFFLLYGYKALRFYFR